MATSDSAAGSKRSDSPDSSLYSSISDFRQPKVVSGGVDANSLLDSRNEVVQILDSQGVNIYNKSKYSRDVIAKREELVYSDVKLDASPVSIGFIPNLMSRTGEEYFQLLELLRSPPQPPRRDIPQELIETPRVRDGDYFALLSDK